MAAMTPELKKNDTKNLEFSMVTGQALMERHTQFVALVYSICTLSAKHTFHAYMFWIKINVRLKALTQKKW